MAVLLNHILFSYRFEDCTDSVQSNGLDEVEDVPATRNILKVLHGADDDATDDSD